MSNMTVSFRFVTIDPVHGIGKLHRCPTKGNTWCDVAPIHVLNKPILREVYFGSWYIRGNHVAGNHFATAYQSLHLLPDQKFGRYVSPSLPCRLSIAFMRFQKRNISCYHLQKATSHRNSTNSVDERRLVLCCSFCALIKFRTLSKQRDTIMS